MTDHSRQLLRETEAARILREQLSSLTDGDEETIRDTIEGETNLRELIATVLDDIATDCASIEGIDTFTEKAKARKERLKTRVETRRALILNAMAVGEIKKLELPVATISRKPVPPKALVIDETQVPSEFWKRADPKLDMKKLTDALKAQKDAEGAKPIPGATLSNGSETVAISWS